MNSVNSALKVRKETLAMFLIIVVLAFRDVRLLGLSMAGWQVIVGFVLFIMAFGSRSFAAGLRTVFKLWILFGVYAVAWTFIALAQTRQIWPGATLDIIFATGVLAYGATLDKQTRHRWILTIILAYFTLNFCYGTWEVLFGHESLKWFHKTDYNAEGRLRMLAAEPSNAYAPFLVGGGLLWAMLRSYRAVFIGLILIFLLLSSSKAFPLVFVGALAVALMKGSRYRHAKKWKAILGLLVCVVLGILYLTGSGMEILSSNIPLAQLVASGLDIIGYLESLAPDEQGSFATRATLFIHSASTVLDNPFFGVGPAGESSAILERALNSGLITPEIIVYAYDSPQYINSKTGGLTQLAYYGLPFLLTAIYSIRQSIRDIRGVGLVFAPMVIVFAAFSTEGYNAWSWLALCLLSSDIYRSKNKLEASANKHPWISSAAQRSHSSKAGCANSFS